MISRIEALNFRSLRNVSQALGRFQVLVGPNASGKTTFLDVIAFLGRIVSDGLEAAVEDRTSTPQDLTWRRTGGTFQLAVEARLPGEIQATLSERGYDTIRYEVSIETTPELGFAAETVLLFQSALPTWKQFDVFPSDAPERPSLLTPKQEGKRKIVNKVQGGNDNFYPETTSEAGKGGWVAPFKLGPRKSALANLPEDESKFPATTWLKQLLSEGVQSFVLNSLQIRHASPPGKGRGFKHDGSN